MGDPGLSGVAHHWFVVSVSGYHAWLAAGAAAAGPGGRNLSTASVMDREAAAQ